MYRPVNYTMFSDWLELSAALFYLSQVFTLYLADKLH